VRHRPYGSLEPLNRTAQPFEVACIDIVTHLPETTEGYNAFLTETCHRSKAVNLIPGKENWTSRDWSLDLTKRNYVTNWGNQLIIISDRDPKFIKDLVSRQHIATRTELHATAAWHPEADGQSERTNQTVAIALRFFITANPELDWDETLPHLQFILNTSQNASLGCSPYEYLTGFNPIQGFDSTHARATLSKEDFEALRLQYREEAEEALNFAKVTQKEYYDWRHQPINLKPGDSAMLVLHHGYKLKGNFPKKVGFQCMGPLKVLEKIGKNAFRIGSRIHDVVTAAQLEPCHTQEQDPFGRTFPNLHAPLQDQNEPELNPIERILKRRVHGETEQLQYFVKWKTDQHPTTNGSPPPI
jgi:hypothetical protein